MGMAKGGSTGEWKRKMGSERGAGMREEMGEKIKIPKKFLVK
jgi:hypothetical protein